MSRNKAKGTKWEGDVRDFLNRFARFGRGKLWEVYRPAQEGFRDTGDLHGLPFFAVQCKDWRDVTGAVREGTDGSLKQAENAGVPLAVNVVKRARKNVRLGYAVLTLRNFGALMYALARADALLAAANLDESVLELIEEGLKQDVS